MTATHAPLTGPLAGVTLIEMGQLIAGPFCGQLMADYGADVIKVEDPARGDPIREWGLDKFAPGDPNAQPLWWPILARNKRCITANLRDPRGQQLIRDLVAGADALLENFRPGTLERWGMSPEELWQINPRLVIIRVSGYGQDGPYSERPGYASVGEAVIGRLIGQGLGAAGDPPARASNAAMMSSSLIRSGVWNRVNTRPVISASITRANRSAGIGKDPGGAMRMKPAAMPR